MATGLTIGATASRRGASSSTQIGGARHGTASPVQIVSFASMATFDEPTAAGLTAQIVLYEATNVIEQHTTLLNGDEGELAARKRFTQAIESMNGTLTRFIPARRPAVPSAAAGQACIGTIRGPRCRRRCNEPDIPFSSRERAWLRARRRTEGNCA